MSINWSPHQKTRLSVPGSENIHEAFLNLWVVWGGGACVITLHPSMHFPLQHDLIIAAFYLVSACDLFAESEGAVCWICSLKISARVHDNWYHL